MNLLLKKTAAIAAALTLSAPALLAETYGFGFAPADPGENLRMVGSGDNTRLEAVIRLSTKDFPMLEAGSKVTGLRCYLRNDYYEHNDNKVTFHVGSLDDYSIPFIPYEFDKGWNEITLPEPIVLDERDLYIGYQVFETKGSGHHPVMTYNVTGPQGVFYIKLAGGAWTDAGDRGCPLIEAIIETPAESAAKPSAIASIGDIPMVVAPDSEFEATLYVKNMSATPMSSVTIDNGVSPVTVSAEIPAFGSLTTKMMVPTGSKESPEVPMSLKVSEVNGEPVSGGLTQDVVLYVSKSAYPRIPLIEEFTTQRCPNCPSMIYYLSKARELTDKQHTFVAHHSGFGTDVFTKPVDTELLYLFFSEQVGAPYAMFDRTILPGSGRIVNSTKGENEFVSYIETVAAMPAVVKIDAKIEGDKVIISGQAALNEFTTDGKAHVSAYLVEEGLSVDKYPQLGLAEEDGVPDYAMPYMAHHGVIRHNFTEPENPLGVPLELDSEGGFSYEFPMPEYGADWVKKNTHVVAYVARINKEHAGDNIVLNSTDSRFGESGIGAPATDAAGTAPLKVIATSTGQVAVVSPVKSARLYTAAGTEADINSPVAPGVYIVAAILPDGSRATAKIAVR